MYTHTHTHTHTHIDTYIHTYIHRTYALGREAGGLTLDIGVRIAARALTPRALTPLGHCRRRCQPPPGRGHMGLTNTRRRQIESSRQN